MARDTLLLGDLYDDQPDESELIWNYVSPGGWREEEFYVVTVDPGEIVQWHAGAKNISIIEAFESFAGDSQVGIVDYYRGKGLEEARHDLLVLDLAGERLVDGWHRVVALAYEGIREVRALDVSEEIATLDNPQPARRRLDLTGDRPLTKPDARRLAHWWQGPGCSVEILNAGSNRFRVIATFFGTRRNG